MALSRPKDSIAQPSVTVPGVAAGGGTDSQGVNASAGSDVQTSSTGAQVLSASASNGTAPYTYAWTLRTKPSGSSASISSASSATASLDGIDNGGAYVCSVQATDANGFTDSAQVCIDYTATSSAAWTDVYDIDLTAASQGVLTNNSNNTIDGKTWWLHVRTPADMSAEVTAAGMVVDFGGANVGETRLLLQIPSAALSTDSDGYFPRIRCQIAFTSMTLGVTNAYIGVGATCRTLTSNATAMPFAETRYTQTATNVYKYSGHSYKGTWGGTASGGVTSSKVASDGNGTSGVLEIVDVGQGVFRHGGHDGDQTFTSGLDTFRAYSTPPGFQANTSDDTFWTAGASGDGPWVGPVFYNKTAGGSQVVTITRIRVQEYV